MSSVSLLGYITLHTTVQLPLLYHHSTATVYAGEDDVERRDFSVLRVELCVTCLFLFKYVTKNGCNYSVKVFDACVMNEEGI